jgi:CorA-like Mg2+ transporter protein
MALADRVVAHLDTRFLFPFSIDAEEVKAAHREIWSGGVRWIEGLDRLVATTPAGQTDQPAIRYLGHWKRAPEAAFDLNSEGYQNRVFFHPFTRRVFFDLAGESGTTPDQESLHRVYRMPVPDAARLLYAAEDGNGRSAEVEVKSLLLLLFDNCIGILSIGVEAFGITAGEALWINESMRRVYPSSGRQLREGRVPWRAAFVLEESGRRQTIVEHDLRQGSLKRLLPPLARTITSLLYFLDYPDEHYEPVLDERMVVYTYASLDPMFLPSSYKDSDEYRIFLSQLLYVDQASDSYRYNPEFLGPEMTAHLYARWAHLGTWYGFTPYSSITAVIGSAPDRHSLAEGFVVYRMFATRYFIMAMIALFYRATLLDFSERVALVSKRLYLDDWFGGFQNENIELTGRTRAEFLHFNTHWYFAELTNKTEESEHFQMQCVQYRTEIMRQDLEREIESLSMTLYTFYQFRATEAVNRLTLFSMILGCGAVVTGFFGMNFGHIFDFLLQPAPGKEWMFWTALTFVAIFAGATLCFAIWTVATNWRDYGDSMIPRRVRRGWFTARRLRKTAFRPKST